jgi:c-di-GMP-binding flagellar brake protein YcgR
MIIPDDTDVLMIEGRQGERRSRRRFGIEKRFVGEVLEAHSRPISGVTVNISSTGILFVASENIPVGARVKIRIGWPVPSDHQLELILMTRVVRSQGNLIGAQVWGHHFQSVPVASQNSECLVR